MAGRYCLLVAAAAAVAVGAVVATTAAAAPAVHVTDSWAPRLPGSPYPLSKQPTPKSLWVFDPSAATGDEQLLIATLQGVLARTSPQLYVSGGQYDAWLADLVRRLDVRVNVTTSSVKAVLVQFAESIDGYVLTTLSSPATSAALTYCALGRYVAVTAATQDLLESLQKKQVADARNMTAAQVMLAHKGAFASRISVLQDPSKSAFLSDYSVFAQAANWWSDSMLDIPTVVALGQLSAQAAVLGWGPDEQHTVSVLSQNGAFIHAADWARNVAALTNFPIPNSPKPSASKQPTARPVHTVTFLTTDGDNVQWVLGGFLDPKWYGSSSRGQTHLGWTMSAALTELAPTVLQALYDNATSSATGSDEFVGAVSGLGYMYPDLYKSADMAAYSALTAQYMAKAGMSIVNVLGISGNVQSIAPLMSQEGVSAAFYYEFSDYSGLNGAIDWVAGKPVIGGRYNLWSPQFENVTSLALKLNQQVRNSTIAGGYSLIPVHVWSHTVADVVQVASLLDPEVEVVSPSEFVNRITTLVKPAQNV